MKHGIATLRQILQSSVLSAGVTVFLVAFIVALYLSYSSFKKEQSRHHRAIHQNLAELITPALSISDTVETNRLLGLVSRDGEFFSVVTAEGDPHLSDYKWLASVMESFPIKKKPVTCSNLSAQSVEVFERNYEVYCSQIKGSPVYGSQEKSMGVLLGYFSSDMGLFVPHLFGVLIGIVGITLLILLYLLRRVLSTQILRPLENLVRVVKRKARHPLDGTSQLDDIGIAPKEVQTLKAAYEEMVANFQSEHERRNQADKRAALYDFARGIAHDIRGPLSALDMEIDSLSKIPEVPEGTRVSIKNIITRIHDTANELVRRTEIQPSTGSQCATVVESTSTALLSSLIESIVSEKRTQYRSRPGVEIQFHTVGSYGLFANIQPKAFTRAISNVIDNSVEAIEHKGQVIVTAQAEGEEIVISVRDNGKGFSADILPKLGQKDQTFGKETGTGLGLYQARSSVESWQGSLKISSASKGSLVEMHIPRVVPPEWFVPAIELGEESTVIILDDDPSMHHSWKQKFAAVSPKELTILYFSIPEEILEFHRSGGTTGQTLYLVDYELKGYETTGLDIIENLGIAEQSILVTSRYEETPILERCCQLGVKLIPKVLTRLVPIGFKALEKPTPQLGRPDVHPAAGVQ